MNPYYVPGFILGIRDKVMNRRAKILPSWSLCSTGGRKGALVDAVSK